MKKLLISFGAMSVVAIPIATTISCSEEKVTSATINYHEMLTHPEGAGKEMAQYLKDSFTGMMQVMTGEIDHFTLHVIGIDESDVKFVYDMSMSEAELTKVNEDIEKYLEGQQKLLEEYVKNQQAQISK